MSFEDAVAIHLRYRNMSDILNKKQFQCESWCHLVKSGEKYYFNGNEIDINKTTCKKLFDSILLSRSSEPVREGGRVL